MIEGRLCYVDGAWAYFTTQDVREQWGDDWDDVSYEDNAGLPYEPCWHNEPHQVAKARVGVEAGQLCRCRSCVGDWNEDGLPKFRITKIAFTVSDCMVPCEVGRFSVKQINSGAVAWLIGENESLQAGATFEEFRAFVERNGGRVYLPLEVKE